MAGKRRSMAGKRLWQAKGEVWLWQAKGEVWQSFAVWQAKGEGLSQEALFEALCQPLHIYHDEA
jgi:hypothetical protein